MANFQYIIFIAVCFRQSVTITVSNCRFNRRLTLTENRLDTVEREISNFRYDIADIRTNLEQVNASQCPSSVPSNTHEHTTETLQDVRTIQELTIGINSAFQAEKQASHNFQKTQLEDNRDFQLQLERTMSEINIKATSRLSSLESKTDALSNHFKSADGQIETEISNLKQQLSDLGIKYENLLAMNQKLQHTVEVLEKCQPDWYQYRRSCYYLSNETMTWKQALEWCWMKQAQLVEYSDMGEVNFVWNMTKTFVNWGSNIWAGYWIGGNDIDEENQFIWSTSNIMVSLSSVQYWLPGQPDNINAEDCMLTLVNQDGRWNDGICKLKHKFVCERQLLL